MLVIVGDTEVEARAKYRAMQESIDPLIGLAHLSFYLGDLSGYELDGPVPPLKLDGKAATRGKLWLEVARRHNLTIRELYEIAAISNGHHEVVGTAKHIADVMEEWMTEGAADGFSILSAVAPSSLREFVSQVVPELQRRGMFRTAYEGSTLRENLGLPEPRFNRS